LVAFQVKIDEERSIYGRDKEKGREISSFLWLVKED
jgi:hypothetical protein